MILAYSGGDFFVSGGVVIVFRLRAPPPPATSVKDDGSRCPKGDVTWIRRATAAHAAAERASRSW
jgi:hypothetical protein